MCSPEPEQRQFVVYAIPKNDDDDMTEGRGIEHRVFSDRDEADWYVATNESPDNPDFYEIREENE